MTHNSNDGIPILPVPLDADKDTIRIEGKKPQLYLYRQEDVAVLFYIGVLYEDDGTKIVRPICWGRFRNGQEEWRFKHPLDEHRPLLNLPNILKDPKQIIIVGEGEKTAVALNKLFPNYVATTSCGGAKAASKSNWSPFKNRDVILSLDFDEAGMDYGRDIYKICQDIGVRSLKVLPTSIFGQYNIINGQVVEHSRELPLGYDIADALKDGWTSIHLQQLESLIEKIGLALLIDADIFFEQQSKCYNFSDPQPPKQELLPVDPLPLTIIPEPLQPWLQDIAHRMQCPLEHVAIPSIIKFGSLIGTGCGIRPKQKDDWLVIPNLWGGVIGKPGTLKSPALAEVLKPLHHLEREAIKQFEQEKETHELASEAYKIAKDSYIAAYKHTQKNNKIGAQAQDIESQLKTLKKPVEPVCKRFKTNDTTVEKMTVLLQDNSRGLLLVRDELIGLLTSWDKTGHESDRAFYLEAWNGYGSYTSDRIGRGTTHCDNLCLSLERFQLLVYPDELIDWQNVDQEPHKSAQKTAIKIAEVIHRMDFQQFGAREDELEGTPYFRFDEEGQNFFNDWLTRLETLKLRGQEEPIIVEHLSKYRKLMPALALIFHVIDLANGKGPGDIPLHIAEKAAAWCDFLEDHARRIYGLVTNNTFDVTKALAEKLKKNAEMACNELTRLGWINEQTTQKGIIYFINPKVRG